MNKHTPILAAVSAASITSFALLARAVARRETAAVDHEVHRHTKAESEPAREKAEKISPIGKWWTYVPAALLTSAYVFARREKDQSRVAGTVVIAAVAVAAASLNHVFDELLPQPPPPPGRPPDHPVFPSGHAFGTMSVALAAAYVLSRDKLANAAIAFPAALVVPVVSSAARMVEEKHWISDVIGGYLAAAGLASAALTAYEATRDA